MSRTQRAILIFLTILAIAAWAALWRFASDAWNAPLGPQISLPTNPPPSRAATRKPAQALPWGTLTATNTNIPLAAATITPFMGASLEPRCGGPKSMTILAVGSDTRAKSYTYGLADVIRLVRVDFITPRITVLEFPRDLWVEIPDIDKRYGITHEKLNQAYLYGNPGMAYYDGPGEGPGLLARTMLHNFGARPDRYVAVNMHTFVRMIDTIGGLDVYLPYEVDGRRADQQSRDDLFFAKGNHHLSGTQSLILARLRIGTNTQRNINQNVILCALRNELTQPENLRNLPVLVELFKNTVQTDLSPQEISTLGCLLPQIPARNIRFISFPENAYTPMRTYDHIFKKNVFTLQPNLVQMTMLTDAFQTGQWPKFDANATVTPVSQTPEPASAEEFSCK